MATDVSEEDVIFSSPSRISENKSRGFFLLLVLHVIVVNSEKALLLIYFGHVPNSTTTGWISLNVSPLCTIAH